MSIETIEEENQLKLKQNLELLEKIKKLQKIKKQI